MILGDLNGQLQGARCAPRPGYNPRSKELEMSAQLSNLYSLSVANICTGPAYTYSPYDGGHHTLIDHILINVNNNETFVTEFM